MDYFMVLRFMRHPTAEIMKDKIIEVKRNTLPHLDDPHTIWMWDNEDWFKLYRRDKYQYSWNAYRNLLYE